MRRLLACVAVLMLCAASCLAEIEVSTDGVWPSAPEELGISDLETVWTQGAAGYRCVLTWQSGGCDYEAAIMGLGEKLTDEQVLALLGAWRTRSRAAITGSVVDAEKLTNRLSYDSGTWLIEGTEDRPEFWGDSSMCWAGAASNMLWSTGWAQQAVNPLTGSAFASEDEVFTLFIRNFLNRGGWSAHGIRWFFTGSSMMLDLPERFPALEHTVIEGVNVLDLQQGTMDEENPTRTAPAAMADFVRLIRRLKDGAAVGISVGFNGERYYLAHDPENAVIWSTQMGQFVREMLIYPAREYCFFGPYCFDEAGFPVPLTEQDGIYTDETGENVDPRAVLLGCLFPAGGKWWITEELEEGQLMTLIQQSVPEECLEGGRLEQSAYASHAHALTVTGYVMNLSATDPGDMVEALFIANSDNDAAIWRITADTPAREQRPNTYDLYPVSVRPCDDGVELRTLCLEQFMPHELTLVNNVVTLDACQ